MRKSLELSLCINQIKRIVNVLKKNIIPYTMYTSIVRKGRCRTRRDLRDHRMQARKSAGERSTLDVKPMRKTHKVQNKSNQCLQKMGIGPTQKKIKKKKRFKEASHCAMFLHKDQQKQYFIYFCSTQWFFSRLLNNLDSKDPGVVT